MAYQILQKAPIPANQGNHRAHYGHNKPRQGAMGQDPLYNIAPAANAHRHAPLRDYPLRAVPMHPVLKQYAPINQAHPPQRQLNQIALPDLIHLMQQLDRNNQQPAAQRVPRRIFFDGQIGYRADKTLLGEKHTRIEGANGKKYRLLNSIDLRSESDLLNALRGLSPKQVKRAGDQLKIVMGQGGFGKVRLALAEETGDIMVVKKMSPRDGRDEIRKLSLINQLPAAVRDHLVTLDDYAIVPGKDGQPKAYLFETLMAAGDCANKNEPAILEVPSRLSDRIKLAEALIKPVKDLHDYGLYHRDLKPENYLKNAQGQVKLADPGLITQHRQPGNTAGTPLFMPPEAGQKGARADQADAFALGVMLYQLAGKAHPCMDYSVIDTNRRVRLAQENHELQYSRDFIMHCEAARAANARGKISLLSIALQLMHPMPNKRLSITDAQRGVRALKTGLIRQQVPNRANQMGLHNHGVRRPIPVYA